MGHGIGAPVGEIQLEWDTLLDHALQLLPGHEGSIAERGPEIKKRP
jgi:hypothetical protein